MIISCEKCNKKFEISEKLIPDKGRYLKCGSCSYKWHYIPNAKIELLNEIEEKEDSSVKEDSSDKEDLSVKEKKPINNETSKNLDNEFLTKKKETKKNKNIGFLSYLIIIIISFMALIVLIDTFKTFIIIYIPNIDFYLSSLFETLKDVYLFFLDLVK